MTVPEGALVRPDNPPDCPPDNPVHAQIARLESELAGTRGELVGVREALGEARARADTAEARSVELSADLAGERARTEKGIEALSGLADRFDALMAERARSWWKRWAGG